MRRKTKYTLKKVQSVVDTELAKYLLKGGKLPAVVTGHAKLVAVAMRLPPREGVSYSKGFRHYGLSVSVHPEFFDHFTNMQALMKSVYLPGISQLLSQATPLLKAIGKK